MKNTYFTLIVLTAFCAGMYQLQAMQQNEELKKINASIERYERKARMKRLSAKETEQLQADKDRRDELERRHGLTSAQAARSELRQQQLQLLRQQEEVEQPSEAPQSELQKQASVQTLQQPTGRQQQVQQQPQRQPRPRVMHEQSQERLKSLQAQESALSQDDNDLADEKAVEQWINDQFADEMED